MLSGLGAPIVNSDSLKGYFFTVNNREEDLLKQIWDNIIGLKNKEQINYQTVADRIALSQESDSSGIATMRKVQQFMIEEVEYSNAMNYYSQYNKRQTPATDLLNFKINDNLITEVYANMVLKFGLNFFTAYPMDKRSGVLSSAYFPTVYNNNVLYVIPLKDGSLGFLLPKSEVNNNYFNELPFYFEDIPLLLNQPFDLLKESDLRDQVYLFEELFDATLIPKYRECRTPASNLKDNYRKTQSLVRVDLRDEQCTFKTKLYVSGQYSTLTRAVYMHRPIDSTINPRYFDPVWRVSEDVVL